MTVMDHDPADVLCDLTAKQAEVLDLLLQHKTTKQIARDLGIAPNTVDARIAAVREKWGTTDRKATARVYAHWPVKRERPGILEILDARFGKIGRVMAASALALGLAATLMLTLAIAEAMSKLI